MNVDSEHSIEFVLSCKQLNGQSAEFGRYVYCREAEVAAQLYYDTHNRLPRVDRAPYSKLLTWRRDDATGSIRAGGSGISYAIDTDICPSTDHSRRKEPST